MDFAATISLVVAAAGTVAAAIAIPLMRKAGRPANVEANAAKFRKSFHESKAMALKLGDEVLRRSPSIWKNADIPMLTGPGWILKKPIPISAVDLFLNEDSRGNIRSSVDPPTLKKIDLAGDMTFSDAIQRVAGLTHFTNGVIYRPVAVITERNRLRLEFETSRYFDYLDTSEVLAYLEFKRPHANTYRARLEDPLELRNRVASLGILTLTLIKSNLGPRFMMHRRTARVILGADLYHVIPAGEFTPSDVSLEAIREDLSLARNIFREYSEELLNDEDAQGDGSRRIDYETKFPYKELSEALVADGLKISTFGLGLDPLTWKPELLTVAVFEEKIFNEIFSPGQIVGNYEGKPIEGVSFDESSVERYLASGQVRLGAKACLKLAWQHRAALGLT